MNVKTPLRIRQDLENARARIELLISVLALNQREKRWGLGEATTRTIEGLRRLLDENSIPEEYKVAVIGRFKAGKSSFVNELLGQKLAGEDTNPETAAVTTFRSGKHVLARINLIAKENWDEQQQAYKDDSTDPASHRAANWAKFASRDRRAGSDASLEIFDLPEIEREHIRPGGNTITIRLAEGQAADVIRKAEAEFRRKIKQYTSSTKPHHCLVESIEIETPLPILQQGVMLVDTPGLDDTERFRVHLTERAVEDIDAVLFLTKSGASYGQAEKDFLLRLLRKGSVKQLVFVVTQVDQTYEQHVRQARDQDEIPEPISIRIAAERRRIRTEIEETLNELATDGSNASTLRFREQLDAIEITFTSAANHRDHVRKEVVKFPLKASDPGGMDAVKQTLYRILSTESRLAETKRSIEVGTKTILNDMINVLDRRRAVVAGIKDREVAESKLSNFREQFEEHGKRFSELTQDACGVLNRQMSVLAKLGDVVSQNVALEADIVLAEYESTDAGKHWKTRRSGYWGYMHDLKNRVANRIFPKVASHLNSQTEEFGNFIENFQSHLGALSSDATTLIEKLEIGAELQIDIGSSLHRFLTEALESQQEIVAAEEARIVSLLEDFIDEEVEEKISATREKVGGIWGRGTTSGQTSEVVTFYREVRAILKNAVREHVYQRFGEFGEALVAQASFLPERSMSQVRAEIDLASANIRVAAEAAVAGQKEEFQILAADIKDNVSQTLVDLEMLLTDDGQSPSDILEVSRTVRTIGNDVERPIERSTESTSALIEKRTMNDASLPITLDYIRKNATKCLKRLILKNQSKGWPFEEIFSSEFFQHINEICLIDPYLAGPHQRRNLREFLQVVASLSKPKTIQIITKEIGPRGVEADEDFFNKLDREFFEGNGSQIRYKLDPEIHDRSVILDNGIMFKLGRGLDIYKPVTGLAAKDSKLRHVKECEIDIFGPTTSMTADK